MIKTILITFPLAYVLLAVLRLQGMPDIPWDLMNYFGDFMCSILACFLVLLIRDLISG